MMRDYLVSHALLTCLALTVLALIFATSYQPIIESCGVMK